MARSIFARKRDMLYLFFFTVHLPIIFVGDLYPLYPAQIRPAFMVELRGWYIKTYRDQLFINPPAWFVTYVWLELLYHAPLSLWAIGALLRDDPKVPLQLLIFAMATAITTLTCIAEYLSYPGYSDQEKLNLSQLYVPYLVLSVFMGVDMFGRLDKVITIARAKGIGADIEEAKKKSR